MNQGVLLAPRTTLKTGGAAEYFCRAESEKEIANAVTFARTKNLPVFVLGGGSNVLVSDEGFAGVVIQIETKGILYDPPAGEAGEKGGADVFVRAAAGVSWDSFVANTVSHGLSGVENLSGIPGSVGAAPIQNIGAYGAESKDTIESVRALDMRTLTEKIFSNTECRFGYRDSFFKSLEGKNFIVLEVTFKLSKEPKPNISYKDLKEYFKTEKKEDDFRARSLSEAHKRENYALFSKSLSATNIRSAVIEIRSKKFPDLSKVGTAGSFFKNPVISQEHFDKLKKKYPELPFFAAKNGVKVPLAYILDKICGLKGFKKGNVELFQNQPLVLVNTGSATAKEIRDFSAEIKKAVKEKTDIDIEEEVVFVS